jgi:DNA-binding SARP family transcriptional activator/tetratricopeptide (TPR) repeat protein
MSAELEFGLLGPLMVRVGGVSVPVARGRERAVLAVLLLNAGQVVSADQLAGALWGQSPPLSARVTIRNYVMRLRHALGDAGASRIHTRPMGYLMSVDARELDVSRFEALLNSAKKTAVSGSWQAAASQAAEALALWRGEPLADVTSEDLALREIPRLRELRLQAAEARIEAELGLGRHGEVIAELCRLVATHPLREHLHALLMFAYYRSGRQADAMAAYGRAREVLIDELGAEPGSELRELHQRILAADPALAVTGTALVAAASARPAALRELAGTPRHHPGRASEPGRSAAMAGQAPDKPPDTLVISVTELGSRPGPELSDLHQQGLAEDIATVTAPARLPGQSGNVVPRQLPAAVGHFTGRHGELEALAEVLCQAGNDTVVISAIDGMAGIGKTALAIQAAHRLSGQFPDGQLFVDLHGYTQGHDPRSPGEALDFLLRALSTPAQRIPQDVEERAGLYRQRLAGTRTLVVLDNAASEAQVRPLIPGSAGCLVLVTSRRRLKGLDDAHVLALDVLSKADAVELLRAVAGPGRVAADDPVLAEVAGLCGRLPLALRIAAALLRHRPAWTLEYLAGLLRDQRQRLDMLSDGERDLGAALDMSYYSLPGDRQRLFRRLGLVPGPDADAYVAAALLGTDLAATAGMLEGLVDHNLLIQHIPGRYRLHDLIRLHARALAAHDRADDRDAVLGRLLDYYQHTAGRADALIARFPPSGSDCPVPVYAPALPDPDAAWDWLRAERLSLLAAVEDATSSARHQRLIALTSGLATLLRTDGPWNQALALHTGAAAAARSLGDQLFEAEALARVGDVQALTGDFPGAVGRLEQAVELYKDEGDRLGQANALVRLGEVRGLMSGYPDATRCLQQALRLYRDLGERRGQANALTQLGELQRMTGDYPGALGDLEQALRLSRDLRYKAGQAYALIRLGDVRRATGDFPAAARDLEETLALFQELGDRLGQANALTHLGKVRRATGDLPGAAGALHTALQLYQDLGEPLGQANALGNLGLVRLSEADYPGAARHLEAAIDLFRRIGFRGSEAWALNHYAAVITATGDYARASALHHQALCLARETNQPDDEALALEGIGECHLRAGDVQAGSSYIKQALDIFQRLAMTPDADRVRTRLADSVGSLLCAGTRC